VVAQCPEVFRRLNSDFLSAELYDDRSFLLDRFALGLSGRLREAR
jgi:hypothetical protein